MRPPGLPRKITRRSRRVSIASASSTTTSGPTRRWDSRRRRLSTIPRSDPFRTGPPRSNTPDTTKCDRSAATAASAGTRSGSASATSWERSTSDSTKSTMGSGRCSTDPSVSGVSTSEIQRSKTTGVASTGKICYLLSPD